MTVMSKATHIMAFFTGLTWFVLGIVVTAFMYPIFVADYSSEITRVSFENTSSDPIHVALFLSNGDVVGTTVEQVSEATITIHKGEFNDSDFPNTMRVLIADDSNEQIMNMEFSNEVEDGLLISRPVAFEVSETIVDGKPKKTINFVIKGRSTP